MSAARTPIDQASLQGVGVILDELIARRGGVRPEARLTGRRISSARPSSWFFPTPTLFMSRTDIDRGDEVALRGIVAHEYAHIIDPRQRRDICVGAIGCGVPGALAVTLFGLELVLVVAVSSTPLWVAPALLLGAVIAFLTAVGCFAFLSWRREYRADAIAADLVGAEPVLAMLAWAEIADRERGGRPWAALVTHPTPAMRAERLRTASASRQKRS